MNFRCFFGYHDYDFVDSIELTATTRRGEVDAEGQLYRCDRCGHEIAVGILPTKTVRMNAAWLKAKIEEAK